MLKPLIITCFSLIAAAPAVAQARPPAGSIPQISALGPTDLGSWFSGEATQRPARVRIHGPRNGAACEAQEVEFTLQTAASTRNPRQPVDRVAGVWDTVPALGTYACMAEIYWQLGESAGRHHLRARLVRPAGRAAPDSVYRPVDFTATAHAWPALVVGLGWLDSDVSGAVAADSTDDVDGGERVRQIVGFDVPLPFATNLARAAGLDASTAGLLDRVRLLVGTSFGEPGQDVYVGASLPALYSGARGGGLPVQVYAGRRFGIDTNGNWFISATVNAPAAIAWAVRGLGFL